MSPDDFRQQLFVDKHNLDTAVIQQPQHYFDVSKQYALAISRRDEAKDRVREVQATRLSKLRKTLEEKDGKPPTEARLSSEVLKDEFYKAAVAEHATLCREAMEWEGMVEAWKQRSHALKTLSDLYQSGYYQTSSVGSGGRRDRVAELADQNKRRIAELREKETTEKPDRREEGAPVGRGRVKVADDDA